MTEGSRPRNATARFLAWGSAELFFIIGVVIAIFFAILSPDVAKELKLSAGELGTLSGAFFVSYSVGQLVLGSLLGPYSPRLILGSMAVLCLIGCVLFAVSTSMPVALASRILLGIGLSSSFVGVVHIISRDYPNRFSFLASVSQSLANLTGAAVALIASFTTVFAVFRPPFIAVGLAMVPIAIALVLFSGGKSTEPHSQNEPAVPVGTVLTACFGSVQFWMGLVYYSCLFGTVLAYSDLWNIQFQMNFFGHTAQQSALLNAMLPLGVTIGSLAAGTWAQLRGDFVLPARAFGLLGVVVFAVMFVLVLDEALAMSANFFIGFALAGSILGLTAVQKHLPDFARATGTAIVATAAFVMGGVIQPLIGYLVEAPVHSGALLSHILLDNPNIGSDLIRNPDFATYQRGLALIIACVLTGFLASLFFRSPNSPESPETPETLKNSSKPDTTTAG